MHISLFRLRLIAIALFSMVIGISQLASQTNNDIPQNYYNNIARFAAGMTVAEQSNLYRISENKLWKNHSQKIDSLCKLFHKNQLDNIHNLLDSEGSKWNLDANTVLYPFSGFDIVFPLHFFKKANVFILAALEKPGSIIDYNQLNNDTFLNYFSKDIIFSLSRFCNLGIDFEKKMDSTYKSKTLKGTLMNTMIFIARENFVINDVKAIEINLNGDIEYLPQFETDYTKKKSYYYNKGFEITFYDPKDIKVKKIYYINQDLSDSFLGENFNFINFLNKISDNNMTAFIKGGVFMLKKDNFSLMRQFILDKCSVIIQDEMGMPLKTLIEKDWDLKIYGKIKLNINLRLANNDVFTNDLFEKKAINMKIKFGGSECIIYAEKKK